MSSTPKAIRERRIGAGGSPHAPKRRVTQESINKMAELRQQGVSYHEIGARLGCSERTARRYVGQVQPQLHLPQAVPVPEAQDPRRMREALAREFSKTLYDLRQSPHPSLSVAFMGAATKLIHDSLEEVPSLTLELMLQDLELRKNFLRATVGSLYADFRLWVENGDRLFDRFPSESVISWRPPWERQEADCSDDDIHDLDWLEAP